jgi:hypothetical protein
MARFYAEELHSYHCPYELTFLIQGWSKSGERTASLGRSVHPFAGIIPAVGAAARVELGLARLVHEGATERLVDAA